MEHQDQAEKLRKTMKQEESLDLIMASHLPSRVEYHRNKKQKIPKKKKKQRIKYPVIRILMWLFLLLPIVIGVIYYSQELKFQDVDKPLNQEQNYFDQVEFE